MQCSANAHCMKFKKFKHLALDTAAQSKLASTERPNSQNHNSPSVRCSAKLHNIVHCAVQNQFTISHLQLCTAHFTEYGICTIGTGSYSILGRHNTAKHCRPNSQNHNSQPVDLNDIVLQCVVEINALFCNVLAQKVEYAICLFIVLMHGWC